MATEAASTPDDTRIFQQLESYQWEKDPEFQGGLSAILGSTTDPIQIQELTLRAQVFYISRKKSIPVDFDAYKAYLSTKNSDPQIEASQSTSAETPSAMPNVQPTNQENEPSSLSVTAANPEKPAQAPYPPTFAEIVQLITTGAPIPGIKDIPTTLLTDQATKPVASKRRKPWETDVPDDMIAGKEGGKVGGTFGDRRDEIIVQDLLE